MHHRGTEDAAGAQSRRFHNDKEAGDTMQLINDFFNWLNGIVWGVPMIILILGTGLYLPLS